MRVLRTFTKHYELESRQYELFGVDLGEGVRRRALLIGVAAVVAWVAVLYGIGLSLRPSTFVAWISPPAVVAYYGSQTDGSGRRTRLIQWYDAVRFVLAGRRPLTGLRPDASAERPVTVRFPARLNAATRDEKAGLK